MADAEAAAAPAAPAAPAKLFKKRILKKGDKQNFPRKGSNVKARSGSGGCGLRAATLLPISTRRAQVLYTGKLANADGTEGAEFDTTTTKKGQNPLVVKAGVGKLIAGWDAALLEFSVGERAVLTIPPEGAYGAKGMPPKIPPNATLIFEVELVAVMD